MITAIKPNLEFNNSYKSKIIPKQNTPKLSLANIKTISFKGNDENPKQVAFISFETVPINKTGGMADVVGELAPELNNRGMDVRAIIPLLNAKDGIPTNEDGQKVYRTHKGKEFPIEDLHLEFDYDYGTESAKGYIYKVNDERVHFPVYVIYSPANVSQNKTEYQGWIMDQVRNQEAFSNAAIQGLKTLNNESENFNPKYVMSYEWTTAPIIEAMEKDPYYLEKKKVSNINNFGPVYQGRVGAPVVAPYILSKDELRSHVEEPRVKELLNQINIAVNARAGSENPLSIKDEISHNDYYSAYLKIAKNYEKYIPYTTNHLGMMDDFVMDSFPEKGWFKGYYNFYVPAVRKSDSLVSCSDTYMKDLQKEDEYSDGVSNLMNMRKLNSFGITIGLDYKLYNPAASEKETTKPIKYPFSIDETELASNPNLLNYQEGKLKNKEYLQSILSKDSFDPETNFNEFVGAKQYGYLNQDNNALLSSFITRFDPQQKGVDIAIKAAVELLEREEGAQIVLAGPDFNADNQLIKEYLEKVVYKYPGRAVLCDGFINNISQFYAGSDTVLIPSRFAPFELVQLQGMRMGAIPIASNGGGLAEIIVDEQEAGEDKILGFKTKESLLLSDNPFEDYCETIRRAVHVKQNNPERWDRMLQNCLKYKRTWGNPADTYIKTIFNPINYSNIEDLFYIDDKFTAGSITPMSGKKQLEDIEFLKNKGVKKILQIDSENLEIKNIAEQNGIEYKTIDLGDSPDEESVFNLLMELGTGLTFINEVRGKNNKSILAMLYKSFSSEDDVDDIIQKVFADRGINFYDAIWSDKDNIKHMMKKLSIIGSKYAHDLSKLNYEEFLNQSVHAFDEYAKHCKNLLSRLKALKKVKEAVYSGRYYLK